MESSERAYYTALFRRDFREAQRLFREVSCTDAWTPDRLVREAHKCGLYDQADRDEDDITTSTVTVMTDRRPRGTLTAA